MSSTLKRSRAIATGATAHGAAQLLVGEQLEDGPDVTLDVRRFVQESGHAFLHDLGQTSDIGGHDRDLGAHGFEGHEAEALGRAGQ